ncbi:unnamed protein product [Rodentolepis nana]|uniref:CARMIL_C domain-containing protein n=1 Tax=Rodentolepis nana TaxID=102285 RepID=A0A0R3TUY6_RODNA|nr:unnamed protein product [Rodentolepis nana]
MQFDNLYDGVMFSQMNARKAKIRKGTITDLTGLGGGGSSLEVSCADLDGDGEGTVASATDGPQFNPNTPKYPSFIPRISLSKSSKARRSMSMSGSAILGREANDSQRQRYQSFGSVRFLPTTDALIKRSPLLSQKERNTDSETEETGVRKKTPSIAPNEEDEASRKETGKPHEVQVCVEEGNDNYASSEMEISHIGKSQKCTVTLDTISYGTVKPSEVLRPSASSDLVPYYPL